MISMNLEKVINSQLGWLQTMEKQGAYYGPVVHYWNTRFPYSGWGIDWRYKGLVESYIRLHKLTKNDVFLESLKSMGKFILSHRRFDNGFKNCAFELNPSFETGAIPHEVDVALALVYLANYFKEIGLEYKSFLGASKTFADQYLFLNFWNKTEKTFNQYEHSRIKCNTNLFVPNKISAVAEFLFHLSEKTKDKKYRDIGKIALQKSLSFNDKDGGSFQSDSNPLKITYYNSREINALLLYGYEDEAEQKAKFLSKRWNGVAFDFGVLDGKPMKFPFFIAGAGDILSALSKFKSVKKYESVLLSNQLKSGGFKSFYGLNSKNTFSLKSKESFQDIFPVVGWNDKTLNFLVSQIESFEYAPSFEEENISTPLYYENKDMIKGKDLTVYKRQDNLPRPISYLSYNSNILSKYIYSAFHLFY